MPLTLNDIARLSMLSQLDLNAQQADDALDKLNKKKSEILTGE